jgi:hypothetical protein
MKSHNLEKEHYFLDMVRYRFSEGSLGKCNLFDLRNLSVVPKFPLSLSCGVRIRLGKTAECLLWCLQGIFHGCRQFWVVKYAKSPSLIKMHLFKTVVSGLKIVQSKYNNFFLRLFF